MYTLLLIVGLIWLAAFALFQYRKKIYKPHPFNVTFGPMAGEYVFITSLISAVVFLFILMAVGFSNEYANHEWIEYDTQETSLVAMQDNVTTEGRFFLGSGSFEGTPKYFYYYEDDRGIRQSNVSVNKSYVIQEERDNAKLIKTTSQPNFPPWNTFKIHFGGDTYYEFYVPEGTVVESFNLDLE